MSLPSSAGSRVAVDTDVFDAAAAAFGRANASLADAVLGASSAAGGGHGMAGAFSDGVDWARDYDAAAAAALTAGSTLVDSAGRIGQLLATGAANHAGAENASVPGGPPTYPGSGASASGVSPVSVIVPAPPTASGAPGDPPAGWFLVSHLLSFAWPDGDQGRLRAVAGGWNTAADTFTAEADGLTASIGDVSAQQSPEVPAAVDRCCQVQLSARNLADGFRALGTACDDLAQHIDDAHAEIVHQLEVLLIQEAAVQIAGGLLAVVTVGASEIAAQAASVARIAWTASRIGEVLTRLAELVRTAISAVRLVAGRLGEILGDLRGILALGDDTADLALAGGYASSASQGFATSMGSRTVAGGSARALVDNAGRADLTVAEAAGGHTIKEHVGRSVQQLWDRGIEEASTFPDLDTAERTTGANILANSEKVAQWAARRGPRRLPIETAMTAGDGSILVRSSGELINPTKVITVLKRGSGGPYIHTSYPAQ